MQIGLLFYQIVFKHLNYSYIIENLLTTISFEILIIKENLNLSSANKLLFSFTFTACRDLLMRLLEPVSAWRITLKQVMKHKWFTGTEHIPRSIPLGDMMYQKRELCEPVLAYMKVTLRIRTKDTINAVVSNRYTNFLFQERTTISWNKYLSTFCDFFPDFSSLFLSAKYFFKRVEIPPCISYSLDIQRDSLSFSYCGI